MSPTLHNSWTIHANADTYHPNKVPFRGVLTTVDTPSCKAPSGARSHKVILTHTAAKAALPSLLGMAIDYKAGWDGHDARQKCGVITQAEIVGKEVIVSGFLYVRDYPEAVEHIRKAKEPMGMSYEIAEAHVDDMRSSIWTMTRFHFTGAAILYRSKAAYTSTSFELVERAA